MSNGKQNAFIFENLSILLSLFLNKYKATKLIKSPRYAILPGKAKLVVNTFKNMDKNN